MTDYTTLSRREWIALADRFYAGLAGILAELEPAAWRRRTPYLGWRAHDVVAHMSSAIPVNFREVLDRAVAGNPAAPDEFDTFKRNAREVARRRTTPVAELLREFERELGAIMAIYRDMSDETWLAPAWFFTGRVNVRGLFLAQFADNVMHERDILLPSGRWRGFGIEWTDPLVDWFMRELRMSLFRAERTRGFRVTAAYRLAGPAGGEWTLAIEDGRAEVRRGAEAGADVSVAAEAEQVVASAQGRAAPWVGALARRVQWLRGPGHAEDVVARITGKAALVDALARRRVRIDGDRQTARGIGRAFWHFWERTPMTEANIARG